LVGHSMGGLVAQHMAVLDKNKKIKKLVLISPANAPHADKDRMRSILFPKNAREVERLLQYLYFREFPEPGSFLKAVLVAVWNRWENQALETNTLHRETEIFLGTQAKAIRVPTLLLVGENDEITTPGSVQKLGKLLRNASLVLVPEAKHAVHLERPDQIADSLEKFLLKTRD